MANAWRDIARHIVYTYHTFTMYIRSLCSVAFNTAAIIHDLAVEEKYPKMIHVYRLV